MDKHKLVQIIVKDLEEIKVLSEEVTESQDDTLLLIDLALNRARLLCQEIELLREFYGKTEPVHPANEDDFEEEVSALGASDPEFEILNFEQKEITTDEQFDEDELEEDKSDLVITDEEEPEEEDLTPEDVEDEEEVIDEEAEKEQLDEVEPVVDEIAEPEKTPDVQINEMKEEPKTDFRTIPIEELEDNDDLDQVRFMPQAEPPTRPVMREIPKPENPVQEKATISDTHKNEQSVNDILAEKKTEESNLNNGPISSLRASIGLNDRFLFIREIFANNTDKYNTVIDQLDKLETIQQAVEYLKANLTLQKNDTSLKFVELLKRRFSK